MITETAIKKILSKKRRHHTLVRTPGLDLIIATLFDQIGDVHLSIHEETMIARAIELAWLDGASIVATHTTPFTLNGKLPA